MVEVTIVGLAHASPIMYLGIRNDKTRGGITGESDRSSFLSNIYTVPTRLYVPPFCIVVRETEGGGAFN